MTRRQIRKYIDYQFHICETSSIDRVNTIVSDTVKVFITKICNDFVQRVNTQQTIYFSSNWDTPPKNEVVYEWACKSFPLYLRICTKINRYDYIAMINLTTKLKRVLKETDAKLSAIFRQVYELSFTGCIDTHEIRHRLKCAKEFKMNTLEEYEKLVIFIMNSIMICTAVKPYSLSESSKNRVKAMAEWFKGAVSNIEEKHD